MSKLADLIRPGAGRGLDFVIPEELRKRTGIPSHQILKFAVSEMLANSLDTDAAEIHVEVKTVGEFDEVTVQDNGTRKISIEELKLILDFENKASSKRGFFRVSRGYLGNALKCIFGYSYALSEARKLNHPEILVNSHGTEYRISLRPDKVREVIDSEITVKETEDAGFNSFTVRFPIDRSWTRGYLREDTDEPTLELDSIHSIILASAMVNPTRKLTYKLWDYSEGELGEPTETTTMRQDTSILWYEPKQFETLFYDFVRARPETQLKEFISLFRGFTSKKIQKGVKEKLQELNDAARARARRRRPRAIFPNRADRGLVERECEETLHHNDGAGKAHREEEHLKGPRHRWQGELRESQGTAWMEALEIHPQKGARKDCL